MPLLRLAAAILFILAGLAALGWGANWSAGTVVGLIAFGLACHALSFLPIPSPPG